MTHAPGQTRSTTAVVLIALAAVLSAGLLGALGVWQVKRLSWKLDLIDRVEQRLGAAPVAVPGPEAWSGLTPTESEYLKVRLTGHFLHDKETRVQAVTDLGSGHWVLTPMERADGVTVLVNRGFVPPDRREPATRADGQIAGETTVTGLLRLTEPGGAFLRANDPTADRWFSRDVAAIASAGGLGPTAPYFVDADATPNPGGWPVGGLTKVAFSNNHLVYAVTWFTLALMALAAGGYVLYDWRRRKRPAADDRHGRLSSISF
ncbi:MAG TPA: SURF1 family protein [Hyphomicrobium sp.]|nr:SURF1 family protein [Hyphomicrobium sp.]